MSKFLRFSAPETCRHWLYRRHLGHDEDVCAEIEDLAGDIAVNSGYESDDRDNRGHTNDDASIDRNERSLFAQSDCRATRMASVIFMRSLAPAGTGSPEPQHQCSSRITRSVRVVGTGLYIIDM